jgi:hypothetical protein
LQQQQRSNHSNHSNAATQQRSNAATTATSNHSEPSTTQQETIMLPQANAYHMTAESRNEESSHSIDSSIQSKACPLSTGTSDNSVKFSATTQQQQQQQEIVMLPQANACHMTAESRNEESSNSIDSFIQSKTCPLYTGTFDRSVKFSATTRIRRIPHHRDMTKEEIGKVWMSSYEIHETRELVRNTVILINSGIGDLLTEEDDFCSRGLEYIVEKKQHAERVKKSLGVCLAMQRFLRRAGTKDPNMIAKAYKEYTMASRKLARQMAVEDQKSCHPK